MNLLEKNNLYLSQRNEIERLNNLVLELENKLIVHEEFDKIYIVRLFLENFFKDNPEEIQAKDLYKKYRSCFDEFVLGKRNFYKVAAIYGYHSKRGNENKLFVHGK